MDEIESIENEITPDIALKELARRELARRESNKIKQVEPNENLLQKGGSLARKYINEPVENLLNPKDLLRQADEMASGYLQGLANIGPGLYNLGAKGANLIPRMNVQEKKGFHFAPDTTNALLGEIGSFFGPGMLSKIPELATVPKHISSIPKIANAIKKASDIVGKSPIAIQKIMKGLGSETGKSVGKNALLGSVMLPENQGLGAGLGATGAALGKLIPKGIEALKPSNLLRGNLTPEELQANLRATEGTQTGLGDVIQNPLLKKFYENKLANLPLSGANQTLAETGKSLVNKGQQIFDKYLGGNAPEQLEEVLGSSLKQAKKSEEELKKGLYTDVNDRAKEIGLKLQLPNFSNEVKRYSKLINSSSMLKNEPGIKSLLNKLKNYEEPVKVKTTGVDLITGKPVVKNIKYPTLQESNVLSSKLYSLGNKLKSSSDAVQRGEGSVFLNLSKILKKDIKSGIEKSGDVDLKNLFNKAEENYKENYSKFLDKDILKYTEKGESPQNLINKFLAVSKKSDKSDQLNKLLNVIPENNKNAIISSYFSRALEGPEGNQVINPNKLSNLWKSLGTKQKKSLIPNKSDRLELDDYINLVGKNTESLNLMYNPKTGARGLIHDIYEVPVGLAMRPINKLLTSEKYRNKLVNEMIKKG